MQVEEFRALVKDAVEQGRTLSRWEARGVLGMMLTDEATASGSAGHAPSLAEGAPLLSRALPVTVEMALAALLATMARRGETAEELCGFAEAMRAAATAIPLGAEERLRLVDTCGTGGDGLDTFNISTAAALVTAGVGVWVAKHGNRAVTSRCGSADVLEALGVPVRLEPEQAAECLRATGFAFLLAPALHPALARVAWVRRSLPFRTLFNLAGPLANPAGASAQVVGVYAEERVQVVAEALRLLGTRHAWVVHGRVERAKPVVKPVVEPDAEQDEEVGAGHEPARGLDELTVTGESVWAEVVDGEVRRGVLRPETYGLHTAGLEALRGGETAADNARLILEILQGREQGARREIVVMNAAAALVVAGVTTTFRGGLEQAAASIDSGAALGVLERLREFTV